MLIYIFNNDEFESLEELRDALEYELDKDNTLYDEMLEELGDVQIGGLWYSHSLALERIDPIAYRVGMNDYSDYIINEIMYELETADSDDYIYTPAGDIEVVEDDSDYTDED